MSADTYMILELLSQQQQQQQQQPWVDSSTRPSHNVGVRDVGINTLPYCDTDND